MSLAYGDFNLLTHHQFVLEVLLTYQRALITATASWIAWLTLTIAHASNCNEYFESYRACHTLQRLTNSP